ncbi:MAG: hypothetical protein ACLTSG_08560 [Lachnospiraceae bacterium]
MAEPSLNVALLRYFNPIGAHTRAGFTTAGTRTISRTTSCPLASPRFFAVGKRREAAMRFGDAN